MADTAFTVTRVFEAPRERVWREWIEPEAFADWFGGPEAEVPLDTVEMDVTPGGRWRATMFAGPDRREIHWKGEYVEVKPPERLVFTLTDHPDDESYARITVELTTLDERRTEMRFEQRGPLPPEAEDAARRGWSRFFDRIAERLAGGQE